MNQDLLPTTSIDVETPVLPIKNYQEFYPYYLGEHTNVINRRLHFIGSTIGLYCLTKAVRKRSLKWLGIGLASGYACAWVGHFVFEKNKPATFKQPFFSFISDWKMYGDVFKGKVSLQSDVFDTFR